MEWAVRTTFLSELIGFLILVGALSCSTLPQDVNPKEVKALEERIPEQGPLSSKEVKAGITALAAGDYEKANTHFSEALRYEPTNGPFHFLNALTYHLRAERGDTSQMEFAEVGYQMALQFDPRQPWAAHQLGRLKFKQGNFEQSQAHLAQAILLDDKDSDLFHDLAVASYYSRDLQTAKFAINKAMLINPHRAQYFATSAMVSAAEGNRAEAIRELETFQLGDSQAQDKKGYHEFLKHRIDDWNNLYVQGNGTRLAELSPSLAQTANDASRDNKIPSISNPGASNNSKPGSKVGAEMCLIDVVIIKSEQRLATNKGVNLLSGLQMQFGGSATFGDTWGTSNTRSGTTAGSIPISPDVTSSLTNTQGFSDRGETSSGKTQALTSTITIPTINYNLNIFNSSTDHNEVIARPTLVATDGTPSEFFSGSTIRVGMPGGVGVVGALQEIPVGVKLVVTPTFINEDKVKLEVESSREFWESGITGNTFHESLITSKTRVSANVTMGFSETLILSGLTEKANSKIKDGVPILKDIPILQYLFSNERTSEYTKSVLILLSPHHPRFTNRESDEKLAKRTEKRTTASVRSLQNRFPTFFPAPNVDILYQQLQGQQFFAEFRRGDVSLEKWDNFDSFSSKINHALDFIYY